jgi:branched-chain amino acid transport system permease protein
VAAIEPPFPSFPDVVTVAARADAPERPRVPAAAALLTVQGLSRRFGGLKAVDNVSFDIPTGAILGIIGPNGAGKTTLFNLLNGFLPPDAGRIMLDGRDMVGRPPHQLCRAGVGRTFQIMRPFLRMSVADNVLVGAYVRCPRDREAREAAASAIARVGLRPVAARAAGELTTKELRLMELARALAGGPRLLLLDEPLAGLGRAESDQLVAIVRQLAESGITVAIIEHTMNVMVRLATRFLVLDHGSVLAEGPPDTIIRDERVIEAYLGKRWSHRAER